MRIAIDLKTKIISNDTRVYLARAGKGGHMFEQVLQAEAIGPDLPNLNLNLRNGFEDEIVLENKIKMARSLKKWLLTPVYNRIDEPSRRHEDYFDIRKTSGHAQIEGIVRGYFSDLQGGDVVVIPNPFYFGDAIIAELMPLGNYTTPIAGTGRFEGYNFDGRKFASFKTVKMSDLPRSVIDLARAPTGLAEIVAPDVKKRIFELGFSDFAFDDEFVSKIHTTKRDFTPFDGNVLNALVNMISNNVEILEENNDEANLLGLVDAAFIQAPNDDLQVKININSPGDLSIFDRSIVPLVTSVILGILISVDFSYDALANDDLILEVNNSSIEEALDLCSHEVSSLAQAMLKLLPEDKFRESCELLRATHADTGANVNIKVEVHNE